MRQNRVLVIGAGISGLMTAWALVRKGFQVEIWESDEKPGGLIQTLKTEHGIVETAANGFINSKDVELLFSELGLKLTETLPFARKRYFFEDGQCRRWPMGPIDTLRFVCGLIWFLAVRPKPNIGESLQDYTARIFGFGFSQRIVRIAVRGIYAAEADALSADLLLARFFKKRKPVGKPKIRGTVSAEGGMGQVISRLCDYLKTRGVLIYYGKEASLHEVVKEAAMRRVILATPIWVTKDLCPDPIVRQALAEVPIHSLVTTTLFFRNENRMQAFGVLFAPDTNKSNTLGVLLNECVFPSRVKDNVQSETWIQKGIYGNESEDEVLNSEIRQRRKQLWALQSQPLQSVRTKWRQAFPLYGSVLYRAQSQIEKYENEQKEIRIIGNFKGAVGIGAVLSEALRMAEQFESEKL